MQQSRYDELKKEYGALELGRPHWTGEQWNKDQWNDRPVTVLICNYKTKDEIQLNLESLLRFYPDIKILVVDNDSNDNSTLYLRYMALKHSNINIWERKAYPSHGLTMHEAIVSRIDTGYILMMDSDIITMRGGWIEQMAYELESDNQLYAIGKLMIVSKSNFGVGAPKDDNDILPYPHPSTSMIKRSVYMELNTPFNDNGSPLAHNYLEAIKRGYTMKSFPMDRYNAHLMGTSWVKEHKIIWESDFDVYLRPFITFVTYRDGVLNLIGQTDDDFDIKLRGRQSEGKYYIYGKGQYTPTNDLAPMRLHVSGEYVCVLESSIDTDFVHKAKLAAIELKAPLEFEIDGIKLIERKHWQENYSIKY